jgi:Sel1 repeat
MYADGRGVAKNEAEAARLYRLAAEEGYAVAQFILGVNYEFGRGVAKDEVEAARLYRLAAEQAFAPTRAYLGIMYENGSGGLPKDTPVPPARRDRSRSVQPRLVNAKGVLNLFFAPHRHLHSAPHSHGHTRSSDLSSITLRRLQRTTSSSSAQILQTILQRILYAPIAREGCTDSAWRSQGRARALLANLGPTAPSVRPSLNIRQAQPGRSSVDPAFRLPSGAKLLRRVKSGHFNQPEFGSTMKPPRFGAP